jgi:hypothetical protein
VVSAVKGQENHKKKINASITEEGLTVKIVEVLKFVSITRRKIVVKIVEVVLFVSIKE